MSIIRFFRRFLKTRPLLLATLLLPALITNAWSADLGDGGHTSVITSFLLNLVVILVAAKIGGELFERLNQSAVLGELLFGIVLGNLSLFGFPFFEAMKTDGFLVIAAEIGVILLLFEVGLDSDLNELLAVGRSALGVALLGIVTPILLGYFVSSYFLGAETAWYVHLFVGATLAATSVGITARVLKDLEKMRTLEARIIMGAAVVDDILGLIVLAFVLGIVRNVDTTGSTEISYLPMFIILLKAISFLVGSIVVGRLISGPLIRLVQRAKVHSMPVVTSIIYCFLMSALAELIGLAAIIGAFTAGLVIDEAITRQFGHDQDRDIFQREKKSKYESMLNPLSAVFIPIFFVHMGLQVDITSFASSQVLLFAAALSFVAIISKQVCSLGVLEKGINRWVVGIGMIPRGEVGLIFAGVGISATVSGEAIFNNTTFSAIVAMVMLTTLVTPPLLKRQFSRNSR